MAQLSRFQRMPAGAQARPVVIDSVPAEWVSGPAAETDRVILYLHGGAFVMGSPATHREMAARLSTVTKTEVLVLDYRLAPEHPFPAALQDALAAASHLVIGGDSAGGGLALQALIALREGEQPLPAAAFFLSPVADWTRFDGEAFATRAKVDPVNDLDTCRYTGGLYVGDNDPEPRCSTRSMRLCRAYRRCVSMSATARYYSATRFAWLSEPAPPTSPLCSRCGRTCGTSFRCTPRSCQKPAGPLRKSAAL
jgi:acetyl esterase/lipase